MLYKIDLTFHVTNRHSVVALFMLKLAASRHFSMALNVNAVQIKTL